MTIQIALVLIILVLASLWYTRRQLASARPGKMPELTNPATYAMLVLFALVLAFLWR